MKGTIANRLAKAEIAKDEETRRKQEAERVKAETDAQRQDKNLQIVKNALDQLLLEFNDAVEPPLQLNMRVYGNKVAIKRANNDLITLTVSYQSVYYKVPSESSNNSFEIIAPQDKEAAFVDRSSFAVAKAPLNADDFAEAILSKALS